MNDTLDPLGSEDPATLLMRAGECIASGESDEAHALYMRATEIDPHNAHAWAGRAATSTRLDESIACWAYTLGLAPQDEEAAKALDDCIGERLTNCEKSQAGQIIALARTLAQVGLGSQARRLLLCVTELDEANKEAWLWRAGVTEDRDEVILCLEKALSLDPENRQAKAGLDWARAQETQARRLSRAAERAARLVDEGKSLFEAGDKERAHAKFARACELDPTCEEAWVWRGGITTDSHEAIGCMERALAINPENESAKSALALLQVRQLREEAQAAAERTEAQTELAQAITKAAVGEAEPQATVQQEEAAPEQPPPVAVPIEPFPAPMAEPAPSVLASIPPAQDSATPMPASVQASETGVPAVETTVLAVEITAPAAETTVLPAEIMAPPIVTSAPPREAEAPEPHEPEAEIPPEIETPETKEHQGGRTEVIAPQAEAVLTQVPETEAPPAKAGEMTAIKAKALEAQTAEVKATDAEEPDEEDSTDSSLAMEPYRSNRGILLALLVILLIIVFMAAVYRMTG